MNSDSSSEDGDYNEIDAERDEISQSQEGSSMENTGSSEGEETQSDLGSSELEHAEDGGLDEEDLELIQENIGIKKKLKRLKPVSKSIIDSESEEAEPEESLPKKHKTLQELFEEEEEEAPSDEYGDLSDFIEDEEMGDVSKTPSTFKSKPPNRKSMETISSYNLFRDLPKDLLQDLLDVFGDGTDYIDAMDELTLESDYKKEDAEKKSEETAKDYPSLPDCPERLLEIREGIVDDREINWIVQRMIANNQSRFSETPTESIYNGVKAVLQLLIEDLVEVPFIATHRKEKFQHVFGLNDLWHILDDHLVWLLLLKQMNAMTNRISSLKLEEKLKEQIMSNIPSLESLEELNIYAEWAKTIRSPSQTSILNSKLFFDNIMAGAVINRSIVMDGSKEQSIKEWSIYPPLVKFMFQKLEPLATVTTRPTDFGMKEINMNHSLASMKFVTGKPISSIPFEMFIQLWSSENLLLKTRIEFKDLDEILNNWKRLSGDIDDKDISEIFTRVVERVKKLIISKLRTSSEVQLAQTCQFILQEKLMVAPWNITEKDGAHDDVIFSISRNDSLAFVVVLNSFSGQVLDYCRLPHSYISDDDNLWKQLDDLISNHQPSVMVVSNWSPNNILGYFERLRQKYENIPILWAEDDCARIYQHSPRSNKEQLTELPLLGKYCVSVGRRFINPLFEYCSLSDEELSKLPLHYLQSSVPEELILKYLHRAQVNVVNLVGLNLEHINCNSWTRSPFQYICGMGPRRISKLILGTKPNTPILPVKSRSELKDHLETIITKNASSFIIISDGDDPLDMTRIHPSNYPIARKMAADALEQEYSEDSASISSKQIKLIMKDYSKLNDLLLDEYAKELEKQLNEPKHLTLFDIKAELQNPFIELRKDRPDGASPEAVFEMLTGASERNLFKGALVSATVKRIKDKLAWCTLDTGVPAIIHAMYLPPLPHSNRPPQFVGQALKPGQNIMAAIIGIDLKKIEVQLSMLPEDLCGLNEPRFGFDNSYDFEADKLAHKKYTHQAHSKTLKSHQESIPINKRIINHPAFRDVDRLEAEKILSTAILGEVIVRPSLSKGFNHVALTWKVDEPSVFQHIDIEEHHSNGPSSSDSEKKLMINGFFYEDLDEVIARFIEPISAFIADLRRCHKFLKLTTNDTETSKAEIESYLNEQRKTNPDRIAYCLTLDRQFVGSVLLSFQSGLKPHNELIKLTPEGFVFHGRTFEKIESLVNWFKQHYRTTNK